MHERQDTPYFLAALQVLTSFQEESNLWKHQLLSAIAAQREQHVLHMLEELWKSIEQHVLVLTKQLSLHLHSDGSATAHSIFCSSSVRALGVPQRERWVELPPHRFSAGVCTSTAFWIKVNIQGINSLIHLTPGSYWYQRTAVGKELTRCCCITQVWTKDLGLSQYTLETCLELGISSPSDFSSLSHEAVLCPFRSLWNPIRCPLYFCTDWFKGSINEINGNEYRTAKKKCFLTQHRNLLS